VVGRSLQSLLDVLGCGQRDLEGNDGVREERGEEGEGREVETER
jgi:hypothetical protein